MDPEIDLLALGRLEDIWQLHKLHKEEAQLRKRQSRPFIWRACLNECFYLPAPRACERAAFKFWTAVGSCDCQHTVYHGPGVNQDCISCSLHRNHWLGKQGAHNSSASRVLSCFSDNDRRSMLGGGPTPALTAFANAAW